MLNEHKYSMSVENLICIQEIQMEKIIEHNCPNRKDWIKNFNDLAISCKAEPTIDKMSQRGIFIFWIWDNSYIQGRWESVRLIFSYTPVEKN